MARFEEGFEARLGIAREKRPGLVGVLAGEAAGGNGGADREPNGEAVRKDRAACIVSGSAAAGSNDNAGGAGGASKGSTLQLAKRGFALLVEDGGNRAPSRFLDEGVSVHEGPAEAAGEEASDAGFAAPGEANEEDVVRHGISPNGRGGRGS